MKRLYNALSDETEPVIKHARLRASSQSPSLEINENEGVIITNLLDSQNEHDDNENMNNICQPIENTIILISDTDSDDDDQSIDVTGDISPSINTLSSPSLSNDVEDEEITTENNHELIDLTEDASNSPCCLSNQDELKSSIDIEECPICLETFSDLQSIGVYLLITPCHHVLCTLCIHELLSTSSRCPLCRKTINSTTLMPYCILT